MGLREEGMDPLAMCLVTLTSVGMLLLMVSGISRFSFLASKFSKKTKWSFFGVFSGVASL